MTYPDALTYLSEARRFGMKLGLEPMFELARALGEPQKKLRFIHIAGTNGKGSTAAFCESCLRAAGNRVGLYTSPHLISIRERIQVDRQPISEDEFAEGMAVLREKIEKMPGQAPTFFEITTGLALWYFEKKQVDWVVWETGLGGRLDATNIVHPEICIITNIGLDHQQYLGETLAEIAAEKAGIIKYQVQVVSGVEIGEASEIIANRAKAEHGMLTLMRRDMKVENLGMSEGRQRTSIDGHEFELGMIGSHQVDNAACAVEAMWQIRTRDPQSFGLGPDCNLISDEAIVHGLATVSWPGRFEIISENPLMVLDGAHNPAGVKMLIETWREFLTSRFGWKEEEINGKTHLVFGSVADKNITEVAQLLRPLVKEISLVRLVNERTADPVKLAEYFPDKPCAIYDSVADVWRNLEEKKSASPVLISGSLFLVGEMLAQRRGDAGEYEFNERLEKR